MSLFSGWIMQNTCQPCPLNASGAPVELKDEMVWRLQANVDVYNGAVKSEQHRRGTLSITSHRLIWRGESAAIQWMLSQVRPTTVLRAGG